MKTNKTVICARWQVTSAGSRALPPAIRHSSLVTPAAFTLIEVMVVVVLLSFIIIALMGVFNSTQAAFRASVTQTDVLESGRAAMDLVTDDLRAMSPSFGVSNSAPAFLNNGLIPVNFFAGVNNGSTPLSQLLVGSVSGAPRDNVVESFFILSRQNQTWTGVGYYVDTSSTKSINSLYRFSMSTNVSAANGAAMLYYNFLNAALTNSPPWSHLMDGVIGFRVRAYDPYGVWLTNGYAFATNITAKNINFFPATYGEVGFYMFSNTLPAAVEIEMATLEDRTLQRASSFPTFQLQTNYLSQQSGKVHVFRQHVAIPNVDPLVYQ